MTDQGDSKSMTAPRIPARKTIAVVTPLSLVAASFVPMLATGAAAAGSACKTAKDGAIFVTATCRDPLLARPFVDKKEKEATKASGIKVRYTYVHGGFRGTDAKFAFYFPAKSKYRGRFFEGTYPTVTDEGTPTGDPTNVLGGDTPADIAFAISHGAYVVSDNNNGGVGGPPDLGAYRVNAAAAKYSTTIAKQMYGKSVQTRGYLYGGSGGAYQTLGAVENTSGIWEGSAPMVPGTPNSIPSNFTIVDLALRVLKDKLPDIADAEEPGGSGDPYAGLDAEQAAVLHEATKLGFPIGAWFQYKYLEKNESAFSSFDSLINQLDPTYTDDFWTSPGYAGSDLGVAAARVQNQTTITSLVGNPLTGIVVADTPTGDLTGAALDITGGDEAGASFAIGSISGATITFAPGINTSIAAGLRVGDAVSIDNSAWLADQYYQRYQLPDPSMYAWNEYRDSSGTPLYPQRRLLSPTFANAAGGALQTGDFHGKMIMLGSGLDYQAFPWSADWYNRTATGVHGSSYMTKNYRIWYMANAPHGATRPADVTHEVNYDGEMQQALLDLDKWVNGGTKPPASSDYAITADTQLTLPATADERGGVQPVVSLAAAPSGSQTPPSDSVSVAAGSSVTFAATADAPNGVDKIVKVEWSWSDAQKYTATSKVGQAKASESVSATHTYTKPGTYFATVRVSANRPGSKSTPWALVQNVARVRIVVS